MFIMNNENNMIESFNNELTFTATRDFNGKTITCRGENSIATTLLNKTLSIICKSSSS